MFLNWKGKILPSLCIKFVLNSDNKRCYEIQVSFCKEKIIHHESNFLSLFRYMVPQSRWYLEHCSWTTREYWQLNELMRYMCPLLKDAICPFVIALYILVIAVAFPHPCEKVMQQKVIGMIPKQLQPVVLSSFGTH